MSSNRPGAAYRVQAIQATAVWVDQNLDLLSRVFNDFLEHGEWPQIEPFQHRLDTALKLNAPNAEHVWNQAPIGVANRGTNNDRLCLRVRALSDLPMAAPLLDKFVAVLSLATAAYNEGKEELTSHEMCGQAGLTKRELERVSAILWVEYPLTVSRTGSENGDWTWNLNSQIRGFRTVKTLDDFLDIQARTMSPDNYVPPFASMNPAPEIARPKREHSWGALLPILIAAAGLAGGGLVALHFSSEVVGLALVGVAVVVVITAWMTL